MSFKSLIEKMDSIITEGTKETPTGRIHKAEPGGYGRKDDEDSSGKKVEPQVKRGRGRPSTTGAHTQSPEEKEKQAKREKAGKELQSFMVGNLPGGKVPGKKGQVHKIKDEGIEESTGVTDYAPKSKGGTRKELLAKYKKTKDPKDAEAARKAGATQKELQDVTEATKETSTGRIHKAEPGGYGRKDDEDDEGKKVQPQVKRGRGRPKKDADSTTGDVKKWDTGELSSWIIGSKPKTLPGKAGVKHKLKDWIEHVERGMIVESITKEGRMGDVDALMQDLASGEADIYDVMNHPSTPEEQYASKILQDMYDDVVIDSGLHPDDDFEEIIDIIGDRLADEYDKDLNEVTLDPSQVAIAAVKAPGATQPQAGTQQGTQQQTTGQAATQQKPAMGATIIDFKNPNDPLKAALQQAVKNKTVTALGETEVEEAAPKGWEGTVKAMKKHKDEIDNPWALAHWMKGKGYKSHKKESANESRDAEKLKGILSNYPYEVKALDEGWGLHESLYQALCDHYWQEGRIPRDIMYGPTEALRNHVEECYMQDKQPLVGEGAAGAVLGGLAGAVLGKTPQAAVTGASLGSSVQDAVTNEGDRELAALKVNLPAVTRKQQGMSPLSLSDIGTTDKFKLGDKTYPIGDEPLARGTAAVSGQELETLPESELEASLRGSVDNMEEDYMNESKVNEKYMGFKKTVAAIKKGGSAENPEAVAAAIGRKKYGKEKFQKAAAAGKKLGEQGVAEGSEQKRPLKTHKSGCGYNYGHDCDCGGTLTHASDCHYNYGHDCDCGLDKLKQQKQNNKEQGVAEDKDVQMESWENQLSTLLNEGMTITTSTGNEGARDSVSISATDEDAQTLMKMLQHSGLMRGQSTAMSAAPKDDEHASVTVEPVSADEVMGTLEPGDDDGGEEAMGFLKRMLGARGEHSNIDKNDFEQEDSGEACGECGHTECQCDYEELDEMHNETASSGDAQFGPVAGAREVEEELSGGQHKLDVAPPKGKLTAADFKKLRTQRGGKVEEEALDQPATMEDDDWADAGAQDQAAADAEAANAATATATEIATANEGAEETCNECGMYESKCECDHEEKLDEWANSPNDSDEQFLADLTYMTKTISGGLNNIKQDQTVLPSTRVKTDTERMDGQTSMAEMLRKLQNIN